MDKRKEVDQKLKKMMDIILYENDLHLSPTPFRDKLIATLFFNVNLTSKFGNRYPSGDRGQFNPPVNGKFRRFWMQAIGNAPNRWSRVHKTMRSTLRNIIFVGKIRNKIDRKGESYYKIIEIRLK